MRRRYGIVTAAALLVAALIVWRLRSNPAPLPAALPAPNVRTAVVRTGPFAARVTVQGHVGPPAGSGSNLAFAEPGIIGAVDVRVGERVRAGQVLAELDRAALASAVVQARAAERAAASQDAGGAVAAAAVGSAQAKVAFARARLQTLEQGGPAAQSQLIAARQALRRMDVKVESDRAILDRDRLLLAGGVIATKELQAAQNQLALDRADQLAAQAKVAAARVAFRASVGQARSDDAAAINDLHVAQSQGGYLSARTAVARAKLEAATIAYEQGLLRAPADGVVYAILRRPGESVDPTRPAIQLGPNQSDDVTLVVPADTAAQIRVGDAATLEAARSGRLGHGTVTAVVPAVDPTTQVAIVTVAGKPPETVAGDAVSATITIGHLRGPLVPATAIVADPQTGKRVVFVRTPDGTFTARTVTVRARDANIALVASGLRDGERVATQGAYQLLAPGG